MFLRGALASLLMLPTAAAAFAAGPLPTPWEGMDVGGKAGSSASPATGTFTITGSGAIAGASDAFHFVFQAVSDDFALVARVQSVQAPNGDAVAGLMVRDALATTSNFVAVVVNPSGAARLEYRTPCAPLVSSETAHARAPTWIRLVKRGANINGYVAADANGAPQPWTRVEEDQPTATGMIYVGLCAASSDPASSCTASLDHVMLSIGPQPAFDDGPYTIAPVSAPSLLLDAAAPTAEGGGKASGAFIDIATPAHSPNQTWVFRSRGGGLFDIQPGYDSSLSLTVQDGKTDNGTKIVLAPDRRLPSQLWAVVKNPNGTYSLLPQCAPGKGLDDLGGNTTPGWRLDIWDYNSLDPHLQWTINPV